MKAVHTLFAAVGLCAAAAMSYAQPTIQFVDNLDQTATLQIVTDASGSIGAELAVAIQSGPGLDITSAVVNTALFGDANPGDSPFIPGVQIGGDVVGLDFNDAANQVFAAFGGGGFGVGTFDYLTVGYAGSGTLEAFGTVAQLGLNNQVSTSLAVGSSAGPGLPTIQFVDNSDGTVTLQIVTEQPGSTASELAIAVEVGGSLSIDDVFVADPSTFDTSTPGSNPFTGTVTNGLFSDLGANQVFASFGSGPLGVGAFDFLTFDVSGLGTLTADGLVAQLGQLNSGLSASISVVPEPTTLCLVAGALAMAASLRRTA